MTTLRQQLIMKRTLRNLRTWAPPISIGIIIGVLAYFAAEKLTDRPEHVAAAAYVSPAPAQRTARIQHSSRAAPTLTIEEEPAQYEPVQYQPARHQSQRREAAVSTSYQQGAFRNCAAARAAGAAPVYASDPGFGEHLDGDHDGIGCEPYHPR